MEPDDSLVPERLAVALYGRLRARSILTAWWDRWSGRTCPRRATELELRTIAKGARTVNPSVHLRTWLNGL
eukprot:944347-Lingulodinium_polyedra.AAC.1